MSLPTPLLDIARDMAGSPHRIFTGPAGCGKTALLVQCLLERRRMDPDSWGATLVWTRSAVAAELFTRRCEEEAENDAKLRSGYRRFDVTTAGKWARRVMGEGRYGVARRRIWPEWIEREAIRAACINHKDDWPTGGDALSADVPAYHHAILQWAGTLALNGLDPADCPQELDAPNRQRAVQLAAVLREVQARKKATGVVGAQDVLPDLVRAFEKPDVLKRWQDEIRTLIIDDAQDLPVHAARLAAMWAAGGGELCVCMDPDSPTSRFQGAIPEEVQRHLGETLHVEPIPLPPATHRTVGRRAGAILRGETAADDDDSTSRITCVQTADEIEEAYELARRIRHAVYTSRNDQSPLRYRDCGIVAQSLQPTGAYLADALNFYDVPFIQRVGTPLVNAPVVQYALAYLHSLDGSDGDTPPDTVLANGFASPKVLVVDAHLMLAAGATAEAPAELHTVTARWHELRSAWREHRRLSPVLQKLARTQLLPVLVGEKDSTEAQTRAFRHVRKLLEVAEALDRDPPPKHEVLDALRHALREEKATEKWDAEALDRDAVRILTPNAARDLRFTWLAIAGFTSGRWPPPPRGHVLHLDRATEAWLGCPPLTLWTPDPDTHDREWRQLAAVALERCDRDLLLSVPGESMGGEPLEPSAWLMELEDVVVHEPPLADPAHGLTLDAALTLSEAVAAVNAVPVDDAECAVLRAIVDPAAQPQAAGEPDLPVDVSERRLSASLLNTFLECPRRCFYTRLLSVDERNDVLAAAGTFGTLIHTVLEQLHRTWTQWAFGDADGLAATAQQLLDVAWDGADLAMAYPNPLQEAEMRRRAHAMLADYAAWTAHASADVAEVVAREEWVEFTHEATGMTAAGRIDRVDRLLDGRYRVVDYKTGSDTIASGATAAKKFVNIEDANAWAARDLQLPTYVLALPHLDQVRADAAETAFIFLATDPGAAPKVPTLVWDHATDERDMRTQRFTLTQAERVAALHNFDVTATRFATGLFPGQPAAGQSCSRCMVRAVCNRASETDDDA